MSDTKHQSPNTPDAESRADDGDELSEDTLEAVSGGYVSEDAPAWMPYRPTGFPRPNDPTIA